MAPCGGREEGVDEGRGRKEEYNKRERHRGGPCEPAALQCVDQGLERNGENRGGQQLGEDPADCIKERDQ
jgi:hypothetical protein